MCTKSVLRMIFIFLLIIFFFFLLLSRHDQQAMCRSFRFGQIKPVHVYRLIAHGTMEETVYQKQVRKQAISLKVVDNTHVKRHQKSTSISDFFNMKKFKHTTRLPSLREKASNVGAKDIVLASCVSSGWVVEANEQVRRVLACIFSTRPIILHVFTCYIFVFSLFSLFLFLLLLLLLKGHAVCAR